MHTQRKTNSSWIHGRMEPTRAWREHAQARKHDASVRVHSTEVRFNGLHACAMCVCVRSVH
eukprot:12594978-Alexandrium_andersonii.AAC.1